MSTKKKAAGLSALKNLSPSETTQEESLTPKPKAKRKTAAASRAKPVAKTKTPPSPAPSNKQEKVAFSLNLPEEAHTKLRELSFHERESMTQLILEGVDMLFKSRGLPAIAKPVTKN